MKDKKQYSGQWIRFVLLVVALILVSIGIVLQNRKNSSENNADIKPDEPQNTGAPKPTDASGPTWHPLSPEPVADETPGGSDKDKISLAEQILSELTLEEKVGQLFFARCPDTKEAALSDLNTYSFGGYLFFANHFEQETPESIRELLADYQEASEVPMLFGVDEEGGTVVRVSRYPAFRSKRFPAPQQLFQEGGMDAVLADAKEKSDFLLDLGIQVNLAPVCDISLDPWDYMYARSFGKSAKETADYIKQVVSVMKQSGIGSVLKHFPGYGNNRNTHDEIVIDQREYSVFQTADFLPFQAGIDAGADAVLVSHTIVECMDKEKPASLSAKVHRILREELGFEKVIITDDLIMQAIVQYTGSGMAAVDAVKAGNDLLIATDYQVQYAAVLAAVKNGELTEERIEESVLRILQWKIGLGIIREGR